MPDKNRRALGRGLDAIMQSPETDITSKDISGDFVAGAVAEIDIDLIETNPFQPRTEFDETALRELAQSIKEQGVIQPVTVRKLGYNKYQLISGERRLRASKMAGLKTIPVFIRVANDEQMLELALIENIHRENLNAIEVAISYQRLIDECNMTQEEVSEKVGKSRSAVANFLRLLKLPAEVQIAIRDGHISMGHARALININDKEEQLRLLQQIIMDEMNVRQTEEMADKAKGKADKERKQTNYIPEHFKSSIKKLSQTLNTKVKVKRNVKGQGSVVIDFKDEAEFDRIMELFNNK
ncbi:MAG: ParB/RepB/Spo0J family partition protein [Bacteroidales bacterium]|jgi:ParB family chromosome partitioning protein|nr:MAG: chromosome partitioning protein, ParB family [bacterium F082]KWW30136.1 MAG: chromosome partitioning protein, ParB family [bacterium P201]MBR0538944.1 ParB/RepB/Spo0J family partition protein [Bacteroidales bacterium]MBR4469204.1 ParB/RepB/Spo0J family partition protein [Bacteroidales bacterium]MBR6228040.1 ParB/RepB/Spo0J family partition protein [Bacteroidales bacterium]